MREDVQVIDAPSELSQQLTLDGNAVAGLLMEVFGGAGRYYDRIFLNSTFDERFRLQ